MKPWQADNVKVSLVLVTNGMPELVRIADGGASIHDQVSAPAAKAP